MSGIFLSYSLSGMGLNFISIWFNHYKFYIWTYILSWLSLSGVYFYLIESPFYFYKTKQVRKLYLCLVAIAKRNKPKKEINNIKKTLVNLLQLDVPDLSLEDECEKIGGESRGNCVEIKTFENKCRRFSQFLNSVENKELIHKNDPLAFIELFNKKNFPTFIKFLSIMIYMEILWGFTLIINKDLGIENVYFNGIFIHLIQGLSYIVCLIWFKSWKRRAINIWMNSMVIIFSLILLVLNLISNSKVDYDQRHIFMRVTETGNSHKFSV